MSDRIAVCQHPDGDNLHWEVGDDDDGRCLACGNLDRCTPKVYVPAADLEMAEEALRSILAAAERDGVPSVRLRTCARAARTTLERIAGGGR